MVVKAREGFAQARRRARERARLRAEAERPPLTFREFVDLVRPGYRWYRHCVVLADVLQRVADREVKRLMVWMPPRHGKSELISRLFSAYWAYRYPERWVAIGSYGAELAHGLSRSARDFYTRGGGRLKSDAAAVKHWETGRGGGLWACGVDGPATGKGWHLGILDDPIKDAKAAASAVVRQGFKDWYGSVFYTREEPWDDGAEDADGALIVVQTRWHEDDPCGYLLGEEQREDDPEDAERWHIVDLAAIKTGDRREYPPTCTVEPDWREVGEALCPERRPLAKLRRILKRIGAYYFEALFQQNPTPREGDLVQVSRIGRVRVEPAGLPSCRGWDLAASEAPTADWTAGVKVSGPDEDGVWYVRPLRFRAEPGERNRRIRRTAETDGRSTKVRVPEDPGAGGVEAARNLVRALAGFDVTAKRVTGDKFLRFEPFVAQANAGNVRVVDDGSPEGAQAANEYLEELRQAPNGGKDDQIDGTSDAFNELNDETKWEIY